MFKLTIKDTSTCFSNVFFTHFEQIFPLLVNDFDVLFHIIKNNKFYVLNETYVKVNENVNDDRFVK